MTTLSEYILQERRVERADAKLIELGGTASVGVSASDRVMLHLVLQGSAFVRVEGSAQTVETQLRPGEYVLLFYGDAHTIRATAKAARQPPHHLGEFHHADEPERHQFGRSRPPNLRLISCALTLVHAVPHFAVPPLPRLLPCTADGGGPFSGKPFRLDIAQLEIECGGPGASAYLCALANLLLCSSIRTAYQQFAQISPVKLGESAPSRISAALRILQTHFERRWTVNALARAVGLSRSAFAARFRGQVGCGPMEYLADIRMKQALALLRAHRTSPLWEIGRRVGYQDESSFARAFKLHFGVAPRVYLKKSRDR
jgi:AraC-like DNA-binding protein